MQSIEAHVKNIISAKNSNNLAIFVGAGVSKTSNTETLNLPSWGELIDTLKRDLQITNEIEYTKLAQLYFLEFNEITYYKKIKEFFPDYIEPSSIHKLIFEIRPECIITTNWDNILERTVENEGLHYETICSDKDLVKCTNTKKIIKMHGDFKNHNIVFKEDDYLGYSHNFPLIENYVKSILSTHTIMFLGYSYNDINLKHIMKWIQNHSAYCPPMYLITFEKSDSQKKYLENHGITTLTLEECSQTKKEDQKSFLLERFLKDIQSGISNRKIKTSEEESIEYIYEKIKFLSEYKFINLDTIKTALPFCEFKNVGFNTIISAIEFRPDTKDYEKLKSFIANKKFFSVIRIYSKYKNSKINSPSNISGKLKKILDIFLNARIIGIEVSKNDNGKITYFLNEEALPEEKQLEEDREYLNFKPKPTINNDEENVSSLSNEAYSQYEKENYKEAYKTTLKIIYLCKKQKIFSQLLISTFNRNILLRILKNIEYENEEYSNQNTIDLHDIYLNIPKNQISELKNLYDFLNFSYFYEKFYNTTVSLQERSRKNTIYFNDQSENTSAKHIGLIFFTLKNRIMIDQYRDYKFLHEKYLSLLALMKTNGNKLSVNIYEIYSLIRFTKIEFIKSLFEDFTTEDENKRKTIIVEEKDLQWMVDSALPNIVENSTEEGNKEVAADQLINIIYFLSIINLNEDHTEKVLMEVAKIISNKYCIVRSYEAINTFFANQFHLYDNKMNSKLLIEIIETIISKVATGISNAYEIRELTIGRGLRNLYHYTGNLKGIFNNDSLIEMLIIKVSSLATDDKIRFSESIIFNVYNISNNVIRSKIEKFIVSISISDASEHVRYKFETWMAAVGFKRPTKKSAKDLDRYLEKREKQNSISSDCYELKSMVDYLVDKKGASIYIPAQSRLEVAVSRYEKFKSRRF